jgi:hypothetical protein
MKRNFTPQNILFLQNIFNRSSSFCSTYPNMCDRTTCVIRVLCTVCSFVLFTNQSVELDCKFKLLNSPFCIFKFIRERQAVPSGVWLIFVPVWRGMSEFNLFYLTHDSWISQWKPSLERINSLGQIVTKQANFVICFELWPLWPWKLGQIKNPGIF